MNEIKKQITQKVQNAEINYKEATQALIDIYYNIGLSPEQAVKRLILVISEAIENYAKEGDLQ
jgi:hypothetical protein